MDSKAILEKSKALAKAAESNEPASVFVGILNELKQGVNPTEDLLRSTRVGVAVNKLKAHKNPEVAKLSSELVRKSREDLEKKKKKAGTPTSASPPRTGTASPAPKQEKAAGPSVAPDQRGWKKEKVDIHKTGQATRDNCIGLIFDGAAFMSSTPAPDVLKVAMAVELAAFKHLGPEDKPDYKAKMRSLYQNLKTKSNTSLRRRVLSGDITPDQFVRMTHDELKSSERREEDKKIEKENMLAAQVPQEEKAISTALTCSKCGQKKVTYSQAQTRSADEPMTTFCECTVCGKRWKVSRFWLEYYRAVLLACLPVPSKWPTMGLPLPSLPGMIG